MSRIHETTDNKGSQAAMRKAVSTACMFSERERERERERDREREGERECVCVCVVPIWQPRQRMACGSAPPAWTGQQAVGVRLRRAEPSCHSADTPIFEVHVLFTFYAVAPATWGREKTNPHLCG